MSEPHRYSIRPANAAAHIFEVRLTVAAPDPNGQVFAMPAWTPGSYMLRDYARNIIGMRASCNGEDVELSKLDTSRWQAVPADGELTVVAEIFAHDESVRGAHLDTTHASFNGPCVFLEVVGQAETACILDIEAPGDGLAKTWQVATSMWPLDAAPRGFGSYRAANYAELIDHPVEMGELTFGEFDVAGIPHAIAIRGRVMTDMPRLCRDLGTVCAEHVKLLGAPQDLDRYLFLLNAPGTGYGGLEHRCSSSLVSARDNLPKPGEKDISDGYRTFLGLASHEYFHLWNIKRLKPAVFTPYDLARETHTRLLWVFEGVTSYYDDLALVRCGLISDQSYFELLGQTITRVLRTPGRNRQSVAESSFDAWSKFYKQDANSPNAIISYYAKGALIALCLDLHLRAETGARVSLDDVMRRCWQQWGDGEQGMPEDGFEMTCHEVAGIDLGDFFDAAVRGTGELPLPSMLASVGVDYKLRGASGRNDKGGKPARNGQPEPLSFGAVLTDTNGRLVFTSVLNGGPAEQAGVAHGDVAVALDGLALTPANCEQRLAGYREPGALELVLFRGDELITTKITLAPAPADTCYLVIDDAAPADVVARRDHWLHPD